MQGSELSVSPYTPYEVDGGVLEVYEREYEVCVCERCREKEQRDTGRLGWLFFFF